MRKLSKRQLELLHALASGDRVIEWGAKLGISHKTAEGHSRALRAVLEASSLPHAVAIGFRRGLIRGAS